jgi:hypothetical protein
MILLSLFDNEQKDYGPQKFPFSNAWFIPGNFIV